MIISHKYKCIFIKTKKTAGTSFEVAFSKFLGEEDVITPISGQDESKRREEYGIGAQHYRKPWDEYSAKDIGVLILKQFWARKYWNHVPADLVKRQLGDTLFDEYYKFTIERNPWDKAVSRFYWQKGDKLIEGREQSQFRDYIKSGEAFQNDHGFDMYTVNGVPAMDYYIRYEDFERGLREISKTINVGESLYDVMKNTKAKKNHRPRGRDYHLLYDDETKDIVSAVCAREIKLFDYQF
ncbi:MAG: sulfotransferase family 2 domain-containing protein [Cyanobacteria bacterium J06621_11]